MVNFELDVIRIEKWLKQVKPHRGVFKCLLRRAGEIWHHGRQNSFAAILMAACYAERDSICSGVHF
jgi:hypothetical protein